MQVAVIQLRSTEDVDANVTAVRELVLEAARAGADFVTLPENALFLRHRREAVAPIEPLDGPLVTEMRRLATEAGVWLLLGSYPERSPVPGRYYNTSVVIDGTRGAADAPGPVVAAYRKLHLFDVDLPSGESQRESDTITAGSELVVTDVAGIPTGLTICYDLRFPRLYQALTDLGARVLTVPAAFTEYTGKDHWLPLLRARAIENQAWVVAPGQFGHHGGSRRSYGKSVVVDPWGTPVCVASDGVGFATARIDLRYQDQVRAAIPCLKHRHPAVD
ncbi:MAG: carbon-nitrogen hydrolase family protein [Deltaproteobacteria bacterium]|nr:MAG: carbon-nitrogen hydrolase family protein [Deltaproteobacteria bacterium]